MLTGKAAEMMIRAAVSALGIDADSLLVNIQQFQQWVQNAVQHHDKRLAALESHAVGLENRLIVDGEKLDRILEILEVGESRLATLTGYPAITGSITAELENNAPETEYHPV
jgi:hypothetical protein